MSKSGVYVFGKTGRMGIELQSLLEDHPLAYFVGGASSKWADPMEECHMAIDLSKPESLEKNIELSVSNKIPLLIGTTGLSSQQLTLVTQATKHIPIICTSNTSLGITLLKNLVEKVAGILDDSFDIEISETHHRMKLDAPSGTALALGHWAAKGRKIDPKKNLILDDRLGPREKGKIGFSVQRGGGITGDHTVRFIGDHEVIELTHRSLSRRLFAQGALKGALWLQGKKPDLYSMEQALGI